MVEPLTCMVVGSRGGCGGREDTLAWKLAQSPKVGKVYAVPGNGSRHPKCINLDLHSEIRNQEDYLNLLTDLACFENIQLTVVGPENLLVDGIVNRWPKHLKIWGPNSKAAKLEGSKAFAKMLMRELGIPTAPFVIFTSCEDSLNWLKDQPEDMGWAVKDDGLAAGKGVFITDNRIETECTIKTLFYDPVFKSANSKIVIEKKLVGRELSAIFMIGVGGLIIPLEPAQDYKRELEDDLGRNTGGMGGYSPVDIDAEMSDFIKEKMVRPLVNATSFVGTFYAGVMVTTEGPMLLEVNARFGDPETQVTLPRMEDDLYEWMDALLDGHLPQGKTEIAWSKKCAVGVVLADSLYPGSIPKVHYGKKIIGLDEVAKMKDILVFHAGTTRNYRQEILTNGGRVINVVGLGDNIPLARDRAYEAVRMIHWDNCRYRHDIALNIR